MKKNHNLKLKLVSLAVCFSSIATLTGFYTNATSPKNINLNNEASCTQKVSDGSEKQCVDEKEEKITLTDCLNDNKNSNPPTLTKTEENNVSEQNLTSEANTDKKEEKITLTDCLNDNKNSNLPTLTKTEENNVNDKVVGEQLNVNSTDRAIYPSPETAFVPDDSIKAPVKEKVVPSGNCAEMIKSMFTKVIETLERAGKLNKCKNLPIVFITAGGEGDLSDDLGNYLFRCRDFENYLREHPEATSEEECMQFLNFFLGRKCNSSSAILSVFEAIFLASQGCCNVFLVKDMDDNLPEYEYINKWLKKNNIYVMFAPLKRLGTEPISYIGEDNMPYWDSKKDIIMEGNSGKKVNCLKTYYYGGYFYGCDIEKNCVEQLVKMLRAAGFTGHITYYYNCENDAGECCKGFDVRGSEYRGHSQDKEAKKLVENILDFPGSWGVAPVDRVNNRSVAGDVQTDVVGYRTNDTKRITGLFARKDGEKGGMLGKNYDFSAVLAHYEIGNNEDIKDNLMDVLSLVRHAMAVAAGFCKYMKFDVDFAKIEIIPDYNKPTDKICLKICVDFSDNNKDAKDNSELDVKNGKEYWIFVERAAVDPEQNLKEYLEMPDLDKNKSKALLRKNYKLNNSYEISSNYNQRKYKKDCFNIKIFDEQGNMVLSDVNNFSIETPNNSNKKKNVTVNYNNEVNPIGSYSFYVKADPKVKYNCGSDFEPVNRFIVSEKDRLKEM